MMASRTGIVGRPILDLTVTRLDADLYAVESSRGPVVNVVVGDTSESRIQVAVSGEVDADNCAEMGAGLLPNGASAAEMVVDVSALAFIDSSGISELLRVREAMTEAGGSMVLRDPSDNVRRVLEITGLTETSVSEAWHGRHRGSSDPDVSRPFWVFAHLPDHDDNVCR